MHHSGLIREPVRPFSLPDLPICSDHDGGTQPRYQRDLQSRARIRPYSALAPVLRDEDVPSYVAAHSRPPKGGGSLFAQGAAVRPL
jgi:hypothetical protein